MNFKWKQDDVGFWAMLGGGLVLLFFFTKFLIGIVAIVAIVWGLGRSSNLWDLDW